MVTETENIVLILTPDKALKIVSKLLELGVETYSIENINLRSTIEPNVFIEARVISIDVPRARTVAIYHGLNSISDDIKFSDIENKLKDRL